MSRFWCADIMAGPAHNNKRLCIIFHQHTPWCSPDPRPRPRPPTCAPGAAHLPPRSTLIGAAHQGFVCPRLPSTRHLAVAAYLPTLSRPPTLASTCPERVQRLLACFETCLGAPVFSVAALLRAAHTTSTRLIPHAVHPNPPSHPIPHHDAARLVHYTTSLDQHI